MFGSFIWENERLIREIAGRVRFERLYHDAKREAQDKARNAFILERKVKGLEIAIESRNVAIDDLKQKLKTLECISNKKPNYKYNWKLERWERV